MREDDGEEKGGGQAEQSVCVCVRENVCERVYVCVCVCELV